MWFWWSTAAQVTAKVDRLRAAEARLLTNFSPGFRASNKKNDNEDEKDYQINSVDTLIPRSVVPVADPTIDHLPRKKEHANNDEEQQQSLLTQEEEDTYIIHSIHVSTQKNSNAAAKTQQGAQPAPLVLLHGYMNSGMHFYRNLIGLSRFFSDVHSLDLLGFGLSSRPKFAFSPPQQEESQSSDDLLVSQSQETKEQHAHIRVAEDFFVESLEAWRKAKAMPKMTLCGHSMGGYLSVAYAERYPQHVERLILLSPVGVPKHGSVEQKERLEQARKSSWRFRIISNIWWRLCSWNVTVGDAYRCLSERRALGLVTSYVQHRLPALTDPAEQQAVAEYLHLANHLPGSGEYCFHSFLTPYVMGKRPTEERIPKLKVPAVTMLYGAHDWMDVAGGLKVQARCQDLAATSSSATAVPKVDVYKVRQAGHLLMLDNWEEVNAGIILAAGGTVDNRVTTPVPEKIMPSAEHFVYDTDDSSSAASTLAQELEQQQTALAEERNRVPGIPATA